MSAKVPFCPWGRVLPHRASFRGPLPSPAGGAQLKLAKALRLGLRETRAVLSRLGTRCAFALFSPDGRTARGRPEGATCE